MYSLIRNIGSSIGISLVTTLLARNIQINHASLAENLTPFRPVMQPEILPSIWNWQTTSGTVLLNNLITGQASTISYLNDFTFIMWVTLASIPLLLFLDKGKQARA